MLTIVVDSKCPPSEYSLDFIKGMLDRMAVSFHKYGAVKDAYPHKVNALESMRARIDKYYETGNTEWLMDAANFMMIEFMCPSHPQAFFRATESIESPGRAAYDTNFDLTSNSNNQLTDEEFQRIKKLRSG